MPLTSLFARHIQRLERKLNHFIVINNRFSWARLIVFVAGGAATWGAADLINSSAGWITFFSSAFLFTIIVILHRRLDRWINSFLIWKVIYLEKQARLDLDWEHIPLPVTPGESHSPLAIDLDLSGPRSLHHLLDISISRQGSQRLAQWLTNDTPDSYKIISRQAVARELGDLPRFRNRLRLIFRQLSKEPLDGDKLLKWLQIPADDKKMGRILPWGTLLALLNIVLFLLYVNSLLPPFWVISTLAYGVVYIISREMINEFLEAVLRLDAELGIFLPLLRFLERYPYGTREHLKKQCAPFLTKPDRPLQRLRQLQAITAMAGVRMNPALWLVLNLVTPWDLWAAWLAARQRKHMARLLPAWLDAFHELEALMALGEFAALYPGYTFPAITPFEEKTQDRPVFTAHSLGHPLIPSAQKVCNDLQIDAPGELLIITGSNMSGKSTFIRTVGINLCLAYAGGPVNALEMQTIPFRLYTCIRINDSLVDGFSYFYAEVKRLKGLLDALKADPPGLPLLYLIDEIFRGTNNRERLIGSRAYVKALIGANGVGLLATHDLELASLAEDQPLAGNAHFRDEVCAGRLTFDYILRPGPTPSTNALKIMANEGLPVDD
jgi:ABC-type multidrug transport system fused ATPase/permease subunit